MPKLTNILNFGLPEKRRKLFLMLSFFKVYLKFISIIHTMQQKCLIVYRHYNQSELLTFQYSDDPPQSWDDDPANFSILLGIWASSRLLMQLLCGSISFLYICLFQVTLLYTAVYHLHTQIHSECLFF